MVSFFIESTIILLVLYGFFFFFLKSGRDFKTQRVFLIAIGIISIMIPRHHELFHMVHIPEEHWGAN